MKTKKEIEMKDTTKITSLFPQVVAAIPNNEFDSHTFILMFIRMFPSEYLNLLTDECENVAPFQDQNLLKVHGQFGILLNQNGNAYYQKIGETESMNVNGNISPCALWKKI